MLAINIGPSETRKKVTEAWLLPGCSQLFHGARDLINYEYVRLKLGFDRPNRKPRFFVSLKIKNFFNKIKLAHSEVP